MPCSISTALPSRFLFAALFLALVGTAHASASERPAIGVAAPEAEVRQVFDRYREAARSGDGAAAAALVSDESLDHYGRLAKLARDPAGGGTEPLRLVDRMQVEMLRELVPAAELAAETPAETVAFAFESRMLGAEFEAASTLGPATFDGTSATATHMARGRPVGAPFREATFRFVREDGAWRIDLLHTLDLMQAQLGDLAAHTGVPAEDLAETIVGVFTGEALMEGAEKLRGSGAVTTRAPIGRTP